MENETEQFTQITSTEIEELEELGLNDTSDVNEVLQETIWQEEAEQIPITALKPEDQLILLKFKQKQELNNMEETRLAEILQQYRPAIQKIRPQEQLKNYEQNTVLVEDEKTFLQIVDTYDEIQVIPFTYYYGEKKIQIKFDLYPITDSTAITDITENLSLFQDFTEDELITYNKMQNEETLTREEILIRAKVQDKINQATIKNTKQTVVEYLALQLKFHNKNTSINTMKQVLSKIPNSYLNALFEEVQRRNHLDDIDRDSVFQKFD